MQCKLGHVILCIDSVLFEHSDRKFLKVREIPVPTIAAINGAAIGAGLCFAMACDIRVVSEKAKLGFTFVKLGLHPGMDYHRLDCDHSSSSTLVHLLTHSPGRHGCHSLYSDSRRI